ncbi:MAG: DUF427 domain-containing protein [Thermoplasmatota archaeon]
MVKATWNGAVLAESDQTVIVEGNHYFPPDSLNRDHFGPSNTTTVCPWKGTANYYTVKASGQDNPDAAWYYADPLPEAAKLGIKDHVAFWKGVDVR